MLAFSFSVDQNSKFPVFFKSVGKNKKKLRKK